MHGEIMSGECDKCAFCGDKNFGRINPDISDWCIVLESELLPVEGGISVDVYISPPIDGKLKFCGLGCLKHWLDK